MKRWGKYIKPYLSYFIFGPFCMIVEVIGDVLMPIILAWIINAADAGTLTVGSSIAVAGILIGIITVMLLGGVGGAYFGTKASVNFAADLRSDLYSKIQKFSFSNIDKFSTGSLVTRMTNDVSQLQNFINMLLRMALRTPGMMIGGIIMAISLKPSLSLVFAVTMPLMTVLILVLIRIGFPRFAGMQKKIDRLNSTVRENVTNVRVVKSFVREDYEIEKFSSANEDLRDSAMSAVKVVIWMGPIMNFFMYATVFQNYTQRTFFRNVPFSKGHLRCGKYLPEKNS